MNRRRRYQMHGKVTPAAPSLLSASAVSTSQIDLTWTDNSGNEVGFKIERSADGVSGWAQIGTNSAGDTTYSDTGLDPATAYYYRVRAYNEVGNSAYSNVANATTDTAGISDTFTDTDAVRLAAHTMNEGSGWTEHAGEWGIAGNAGALLVLDPGAYNYASADVSSADMDVAVDVTFMANDGGARAGLCLRVGADSLWEVYLADSTDEVELWENDEGVRQLKQKTAYVFGSPATVRLRAVATGTSISVYIDGALQFTATGCTLNQTETRAGLWAWGLDAEAHRWDNFAALVA